MSYLEAQIENIRRAQGWNHVRITEKRFPVVAGAQPAIIPTAGLGGVAVLAKISGWMQQGPTARYQVAGAINLFYDRQNCDINGWTDPLFSGMFTMLVDTAQVFNAPITISEVSGTTVGGYHHAVVLYLYP